MRFQIVELTKKIDSRAIAVYDSNRKEWIPIVCAIEVINKDENSSSYSYSTLKRIVIKTDMIHFLQLYKSHKSNLIDLLEKVAKVDFTEMFRFPIKSILPFEPKSLRDASLFLKHAIAYKKNGLSFYKKSLKLNLGNLIVKVLNFFGVKGIYNKLISDEKIKDEKIGILQPSIWSFYYPMFYYANHINVYTHGDVINIPSYCDYLDYEFEIALIIGKSVKNVTPKQVEDDDVILGFQLFNDFSDRKWQFKEILERGMMSFFGLGKSKAFANGLGHIVVTPDDILPNFENLEANIYVNDQLISKSIIGKPLHSIQSLVSYCSVGVKLVAGEVIGNSILKIFNFDHFIGIGTVPNGTSIEINHIPLKVGDKITLDMKEFGQLTNVIGEKEKEIKHTDRPNPFQKKKKKPKMLIMFIVLLIAVLYFKFFRN